MEGKDKRVMIVGGTGLLGYHAALELLKRGYRITALALEDVDLEGWYPKEIEVVYGDVFTLPPKQLVEIMKGHHAMVYAMGPDDRTVPTAPASRYFREKLVDTSARVFDAARQAGVKRSVLLGSYFHHFHRLMPHLGLAARHPYIMARIEQETAALDAAGRGMDVMILELPYIFGTMPNRVPLWKEVFFDRLLKMNPVLYPDGGSSMICVKNVAEAIAGAISKGVHAQRYAIGDQNLRWKEMFAIMFGAIGVRRRFIHVPHWLAAIAGRFMMFRERRRSMEPGLNLAYIFRDVISRDFFLEPAQSAALLGYGSCDVKLAIAETARACFPSGYKNRKP
ncbi:MAG: NAD-dependent epimerase/dehydratase family protein [Bacteroidia bacterium]|nr:MAG: NAD-dependent epimerase/dehydratase family protein [Bacteroidia bacterium]